MITSIQLEARIVTSHISMQIAHVDLDFRVEIFDASVLKGAHISIE